MNEHGQHEAKTMRTERRAGRVGLILARAGVCKSPLLLTALMVTGLGVGVVPGHGGTAHAATIYYVNGDPTVGSDSHPCTLTAPCATIQHATNIATGGGTIIIAGSDSHYPYGVYCEQISIDLPSGDSLTLQAQSASNKPAIDGGAGSTNVLCGDLENPGHSVVTVGDAKYTAMTVTLLNLIIQNGDGSSNPWDGYGRGPGIGGGVYTYAGVTLNVTNTTIRTNIACSSGCPYGIGGGIGADGALTLSGSTIIGNIGCASTSCYGVGGGIWSNDGTVTLTNDSTVGGNDACSDSCNGNQTNGNSDAGGGIAMDFGGGTLTITNSAVYGNIACAGSSCASNNYGGGIFTDGGTLTLTNSTVHGNAVCEANSCTGANYGGGIDSYATTTLTRSTVGDNVACEGSYCYTYNEEGGGIDSNGTTTLTGSTVGGNTGCDGSCSYGYGGGIYNNSGTTIIDDSTLAGNIGCNGVNCYGYGGGLYSVGTDSLVNSTLAGNIACISNGCTGGGGGINSGLNTSLTNSTVSANSACQGSPCSGSGGGMSVQGAYLSNTILAGNTAPMGGAPDCSGTLSDGRPNGSAVVGHNIIGNNAECNGLSNGSNGDQVGTASTPINPHLGALGSYGGPTQTMALLLGSPAIGKADPATCNLATLSSGVPGPAGLDQRGVSRRVSTRNACDIGAYDTCGGVPLSKGWNLTDVPTANSGITTASALVASMNANSQLGPGAVEAVATYDVGHFDLYVPNYSPPLALGATHGIFVLSTTDGDWLAPGSPYSSSQTVSLSPGLNLVAAPYPLEGLDGSTIFDETGRACGLQEVAYEWGGSFQIYTPASGPAGSAFHVPAMAGMWIECTTADPLWRPS